MTWGDMNGDERAVEILKVVVGGLLWGVATLTVIWLVLSLPALVR